MGVKDGFKVWFNETITKSRAEQQQKLNNMVEVFRGLISRRGKPCFVPPRQMKEKNQIVGRCLIHICKNLHIVMDKAYNRWMRAPVIQKMRIEDRIKIEKYVLKNLAQVPREALHFSFGTWKKLHIQARQAVAYKLVHRFHEIIASKTRAAVRVPKLKNDIRKRVMSSFNYHMKHQSFILLRNSMTKWATVAAKPSEQQIRSEKHDFSRAFAMVAIFQRVFLSKAKRAFNPPMIIKDADEIMTRTIKRMIKIKEGLFDTAVLRWKLQTSHKRANIFARIMMKQAIYKGNERFERFLLWKERMNHQRAMEKVNAKHQAFVTILTYWKNLNLLETRRALYKLAEDVRPMKLKLLRALEKGLKGKTGSAFDHWRSICIKNRNKNLSKDVRAQLLRFNLFKLPVRTFRDSVQRVVGEGDKIGGAIKTIAKHA